MPGHVSSLARSSSAASSTHGLSALCYGAPGGQRRWVSLEVDRGTGEAWLHDRVLEPKLGWPGLEVRRARVTAPHGPPAGHRLSVRLARLLLLVAEGTADRLP